MIAGFLHILMKIAAGVLVLLLSALPALCQVKVIVLQQKHRLYGNVTAYLCDQSAKVLCPDQGLIFSCSAPDWQAKFIRPSLKLKHTISFENWSKNGIRTPISLEANEKFNHFPMVAKRSIQYVGLPSEQVFYPAESKGVFDKRRLQATYTYYKKFPLNKNTLAFLNALYDVPPISSGIPLRFARIDPDAGFGFRMAYQLDHSSVVSFLETTSVSTISYSPELFKLPGDLKEVSDGKLFVPDPNVLNELIFDPASSDAAPAKGHNPKSR